MREQARAEKARRARAAEWRDFPSFCSRLHIIPKSGQRSTLRLNPIQRAYCAARTPRDVVLKPRQIGFTTLELARDVWIFLTKPGARVVVVCQSLTDHGPLKQLSSTLRVMFEGLRADGTTLRFRSESLSEWVLAERDASLRIVEAGASEAAAEKKGRSGTITRLHLTETAFYEYAEATLNALLECVPGPEFGTEIVSESTANGAAGVFYEQFQEAVAGRSGYAPHFFPWWHQPEYALPLEPGDDVAPQDDRERSLVATGVSAEQIKWYRRKVAEKKRQDLVDQEYPSDPETCFLVAGRSFFDRAITVKIRGQARDPIETSLGGTLRIWKRPEHRATYLVAVDPSEGTGGDPGAAVVYDSTTGEHVATLHGQFPPWKLAEHVDALGRLYNEALVVVERNNHGHAVIQALEQPPTESGRERYPHLYVGNDEKVGWHSHEVSRSAALDALEDAHRNERWSSPDVRVVAELLTFVVNKNGKAEASRGCNDDLVMATAIAWDVCRKPYTRGGLSAGRSTYRLGSSRGF